VTSKYTGGNPVKCTSIHCVMACCTHC